MRVAAKRPGARSIKKLGAKPKPIVGGSTLEKMEKTKDPEVRYLRDLQYSDPTEVIGKDKNKHYRFCEELNIPKRESQGYAKSDDANLRFRNPDGSRRDKHWAAEGGQRNNAKSGLVLMEMPKKRFELRRKVKHEDHLKQVEMMDMALRRELMQKQAKELAEVLPHDDKFMKKLREEMEKEN
jgi:hypothetical protein